MSKFKGASQAKVSEQGTKCSDGRHLLRLDRITYSEGGKNGEYYVAEFTVLESNSANDATGRQIDPPGCERVWTQNMAKKAFPFPKLIAFLYAVFGYNYKNAEDKAYFEANIQPDIEAILDATQDESDPLGYKGRKVWANTKLIDSNGFPFVVYDFSPGQADKLSLA